jgi:hypothetical protein
MIFRSIVVVIGVIASGLYGEVRGSREAARPSMPSPSRVSFCADSNNYSATNRFYFQDIATTSDSRKIALRTAASLPATTSDSVQLITTSSVCLLASQSLRRSQFQADTGPLVQMVLYRYGSTRYVGLNGKMNGEWTLWSVYDTTFAIVGNFTQ